MLHNYVSLSVFTVVPSYRTASGTDSVVISGIPWLRHTITQKHHCNISNKSIVFTLSDNRSSGGKKRRNCSSKSKKRGGKRMELVWTCARQVPMFNSGEIPHVKYIRTAVLHTHMHGIEKKKSFIVLCKPQYHCYRSIITILNSVFYF